MQMKNIGEQMKRRDELTDKYIEVVSPKYGAFKFILDVDDFLKLSKNKWYLLKCRGYLYATRAERNKGTRKWFKLHRVIADAPAGMVVDHINGNTLDNRKCNLRVCTPRQNTISQKKNRRETLGKYRGVVFYKKENNYGARIRTEEKRMCLGRFKNAIDAARAYDIAALKYHGEFAILNGV